MTDSSPKDKKVYTFDFALKILTAVSIYLATFTYLFNLIPQRDNPYLNRILYDDRVAEFSSIYVFLLLLDCLAISFILNKAVNFFKKIDRKKVFSREMIKKIKTIRLKKIKKSIVKFFRKIKIFCSIIIKNKFKHSQFYVELKRDIANFILAIFFTLMGILLLSGTFAYPTFAVISSSIIFILLFLYSDCFDIGAKLLFSSFFLSVIFFIFFIPKSPSYNDTKNWRVHTTEDDEFREFNLTTSKISKDYIQVTINGTTKILPLSSIRFITLSSAENKSLNEKETKNKIK